MIGQLVLFLMSVCLSVVFSQEKRVQEKPRLYLLASIIVIFCLVGVDLALSFYFNGIQPPYIIVIIIQVHVAYKFDGW